MLCFLICKQTKLPNRTNLKTMIVRIFLILILAFSAQLYAQLPNSKMNVDLFLQWQDWHQQEKSASVSIPILVKGSIETIQQLTKAGKGHYKYAVGDIASIELPLSELEIWLATEGIERMESQRLQGQHFFEEDTFMLRNNNVTAVHQGQGNIPYPFKGEGVVLGIIDDGFEWRHPDLMHPNDSSSRILHLWDQTTYNSNFFESYYAYGSSWTKAEIDAGSCTHAAGDHGSHVLGTAAGNAWAANKYMGIAPEADIVAVSLSEQGYFPHRFVDAVHYIFRQADQLGQPCAINSSVGTYWGSHDGGDLFSMAIDSMLDAAPGRALIQAGGNARQYKMHWQANLGQGNDTARVWLDYLSDHRVYAALFADTADFNQLEFSFEYMNGANYKTEGQSQVYHILNDLEWTETGGRLLDTFFMNPFGAPITLEIYASQWNGVYELQFVIRNSPVTVNNYWQLTFSGVGKVDMWSNQTLLATSSLLQGIPVPYYQEPDNQQTLAGLWTCSEKVITVAAYQNRANMVNYQGDTVSMAYTGYPVFGIAEFSSLGPARDGIQKPNLTAPGGQVLSAQPLSTLQYFKNVGHPFIDVGGWHASGKGTSMAAPMVAGAAALYFQCQPQANWQQLQAALEQAARVDSFVVKESAYLPNQHWGYGKLDVYELLKACMVYGCTDSLAPNYNPNAHIEDGSCMLLLSASALEEKAFELYPNPSSGQITLRIPQEYVGSSRLKVEVFDLLGRNLNVNSPRVLEVETVLDLRDLLSGAYVLVLRDESGLLWQQKLLLNKQ